LEVKNPETLAFVTQTTLSVDDTAEIIEALKKRFPALSGPRKEDICYATQNRQDAVKSLVRQCNVILVVGSPNSSNSNRLREIAEKNGKSGYLVDGPDDLRRAWFSEDDIVGVTAGASAPELLVRQVIDRLMEWGGKTTTEQTGKEEHIVFSLPKVLRSNR
ncbi:MAG: 4-hydroxy-3-methylbut-2-enyl diphosphate reductase, partial [Gammaproteobacteria bacterium]